MLYLPGLAWQVGSAVAGCWGPSLVGFSAPKVALCWGPKALLCWRLMPTALLGWDSFPMAPVSPVPGYIGGGVYGMHVCSVMSDSLWPHGLQPISVYGISQARILGWVAISSSRGSSWHRDWTHVFCILCIGRQILYQVIFWEAPIGGGDHVFLSHPGPLLVGSVLITGPGNLWVVFEVVLPLSW